jgi:Arc/MetJ-type ribon-helix-helix transcriptional regulator
MGSASAQITDEFEEWIDSRLVPGQNKSAWVRYALQNTQNCDELLDELFEPYEYDKRKMFIQEAVQEKYERTVKDTKKGNDF